MTTLTPTAPEVLLAMPPAPFRAVVDQSLRREAPEDLLPALLHPTVVSRYLHELVVLLKRVEGQLAAKRADLEGKRARLPLGDDKAYLAFKQAQGEHATWRASATRWKTGLEEALLEARFVHEGLIDHDAAVVAERDRLAQRVRRLSEGITKHKQSFPDDDDPSAEDEALWALVPSATPISY